VAVMEVRRRRAAAPVRPPAALVGVGGVQAGWQARGWRRSASGPGRKKKQALGTGNAKQRKVGML